MANILITILLFFPIMLILALVAGAGLTAIQTVEEWWERRQRRKQIAREYDKWYDKYLSCDNFGGAVDKGKAAAICVVLRGMER